MVSATSAVAVAAMSTAFAAMELLPFAGPRPVPGASSTSTPASTLNLKGAVQIPILLALFGSVAFVHRRLHPAAGGAGTELAALAVCMAVSLLEFILFVLQPAGVIDDGVVVLARAVGAAAADAIPAAATVTFVLGITLVIAHIRAGGEGGGTGAVANDQRVPVPVEFLKKLALGAAAELLAQMAMAIYFMLLDDRVSELRGLQKPHLGFGVPGGRASRLLILVLGAVPEDSITVGECGTGDEEESCNRWQVYSGCSPCSSCECPGLVIGLKILSTLSK